MSDNPTPLQRPRPFQRVYADEAMLIVEAIRIHRDDLEQARLEDDDESILAIVGPLSEAYRMLAQLDPAVAFGEEALAIAEKLNKPKPMISNGIRLATALQYRNEQAKAETLFTTALARARAAGYLIDTALQHLGKCLVELGRTLEAIECFDEALQIRRGRGDSELVASTEEALEGALKRQK